MTRRLVVPPDCTTAQALRIIALTPRLWPSFVAFLARFAAAKTRFVLGCWARGYRVRTIRRMAREAS